MDKQEMKWLERVPAQISYLEIYALLACIRLVLASPACVEPIRMALRSVGRQFVEILLLTFPDITPEEIKDHHWDRLLNPEDGEMAESRWVEELDPSLVEGGEIGEMGASYMARPEISLSDMVVGVFQKLRNFLANHFEASIFYAAADIFYRTGVEKLNTRAE